MVTKGNTTHNYERCLRRPLQMTCRVVVRARPGGHWQHMSAERHQRLALFISQTQTQTQPGPQLPRR